MRLFLLLCPLLCACLPTSPEEGRDYRQDMRDFVRGLALFAKEQNPEFAVIIQNGHALLTADGTPASAPDIRLIETIDGAARENLFYGYSDDDQPTPEHARQSMLGLAALARQRGLAVLVTDYCSTRVHVEDSYARNAGHSFVSFAADHRALDNIPAYPPAPNRVHEGDVRSLGEARNFLYLIDPGAFAERQSFLDALTASRYDLFILDLFYDFEPLRPEELAALKRKPGGGHRLVVAYMSIGEAEDYRYYFDPEWLVIPPPWLAAENPDWEGNYKVRYWHGEWQQIIYGDPESYLQKILDAGFDGVYLDIIDAFYYFEEGGA